MKMLIGGKWVSKSKTIKVLDPQDDRVIDTVPAGDKEDVKKAYECAIKGAKEMEKLTTYDCYSILRKTADLLNSRVEEFSRMIATEGVKTIREARKEANRAINTLTYAAEEAKRVPGEIVHMDADFRKMNRFGYWVREPVGIVLAITPYNDPLNMIAHKLGPAIAARNAVVLKPTYLTPLSALKLGELFLEAGLPENGLSIITGKSGDIGDALVTSPYPRVITFTGGVEAGEDIVRKAGLKKIMMELGSSSAVIVDEDADLKLAVESNVSGSFWAAGQDCIGVQRLYIHKKVYDKFVSEFVRQTKKYKVGNKMDEATDMGPMITKEEAIRVENWVDEAVKLGGKILTGGKRKGNFYMPTIIENPPEKAKVVSEEIFGPVVSIFPFDKLDTAIDKANNSKYGLHGAIFTSNIDTAHYAAKRLKFGGIMINDSTDFRVDYMPFGGYKFSGLHREGLKFAIDIMTEIKLVAISLNK